jgi:hypothetical protein
MQWRLNKAWTTTTFGNKRGCRVSFLLLGHFPRLILLLSSPISLFLVFTTTSNYFLSLFVTLSSIWCVLQLLFFYEILQYCSFIGKCSKIRTMCMPCAQETERSMWSVLRPATTPCAPQTVFVKGILPHN